MRYCGECGTDIPEALEARLESARELAGEVQSLRAGYRHSEALEILKPLLETRLTALTEYRRWAEKIQQQLTDELAELQSQRDHLLSAARDQLAQGNISAARMYVARVPEHLQNHETSQLDEELAGAAAELKRLAREIRDATRAKRYRGLAPKVSRLPELWQLQNTHPVLLRKTQPQTAPFASPSHRPSQPRDDVTAR